MVSAPLAACTIISVLEWFRKSNDLLTLYKDAEPDNLSSSALSFGNVRPCLKIYSPDHLVNEDIHQAGLQVGRERWH
jgi:hypothetical protein